jgi:hypothetical protein
MRGLTSCDERWSAICNHRITAANRSLKATTGYGRSCSLVRRAPYDSRGFTTSHEQRRRSIHFQLLGLLRLLPDNDFIDFFSHAVNLDNARVDLSHYVQVSTIDFWPWLPPAGFPDVITELQNKDGPERLTLIIEVKHGAPKSGGTGAADIDETSESPDST